MRLTKDDIKNYFKLLRKAETDELFAMNMMLKKEQNIRGVKTLSRFKENGND